jgi:hypothetical protein
VAERPILERPSAGVQKGRETLLSPVLSASRGGLNQGLAASSTPQLARPYLKEQPGCGDKYL